ncbi:MAG: CotH kinase family protein [Agrobacterium sp.]|nr:CotH kinase family protein [Agrobacterium sp.]
MLILLTLLLAMRLILMWILRLITTLSMRIFKNVDGAVASAFLHKKRDGKLFFGPIWDFDLGLGNAGYDDVDKTYGWHIRKAPWFDRLFKTLRLMQK